MLSIENSVIKHFTVAGINVATPSKSSVFINNTKIENNAVGVNVAATSTNLNRVLIDQGKMVGNGIGIKVTGAKSAAVLTDSVVRESLTKDLSIVSNGMVQSYGNNVIGSGTASARLLLK